MAIRIIITDSSIWTLDYENMQYRRDPKIQGSDHLMVPYDLTKGWRSFTLLEESHALDHPDRIRFTVFGDEELGWITSTYKPAEQHLD